MAAYSPSRAYVLGVYLKRILRWRRDSAPYISIDAIANLADVSVFPPKFRQKPPTRVQIEKAEVIFCPSDRLIEFLDAYAGLINPKVIISGNSDYEFRAIPVNLPRSVKLLLLQNSYISDNKIIQTLPIGVENFRFGVNGNPRLFPFSRIPVAARGRILIGPFGETHPLRKLVKATFKNFSGNCVFLEGRIPPRKYRKLISEGFEYIACVQGNGVDTHRLWETLYRGRKPILKKDEWLDSLHFLKPYIHTVSDWSVQELSRSETFKVEDFNPSQIPEIWMPYWRELISKSRN